MGKFDILDDASDNQALLAAIKAVHGCVDRRFDALNKKDRRERLIMAKRLKDLEGTVDGLTKTLKPEEPHKQPIALWTPRKALTWLATIGGSFFVFAKVLNATWPFVVQAAVALWQAAIH